MRKSANRNIDTIITSHAGIISEGVVLNSKIMYSISCLQNAIEYQNANRQANLLYLQGSIAQLIQLGRKTQEINEDHLKSILKLLNSLLAEGNTLTVEEENTLISIVIKVNVPNGTMGEDLCHEIVSLCSKLKNEGESSKMLVEIMAQKMSPQQALRLIDSFRKNELYNTEIYQLISLGMHYNNNQQLLRRTFQGLHFQICNVLSLKKDAAKEANEILKFIKFTLSNNIKNVKVVSLCALIYRQLCDSFKIVEKGPVSKNLDYFLRENGLSSITKPYLIESDKLISSFSELQVILELELDIERNKQLHYLLHFYSVHEFQWREELLSSVTNGKGTIAKELLLRVTEHFSEEGRVKKAISQKEELVYSNFLPIECLRSFPSIINKLQSEPTPHNALQTIGFYHSLPKNHPQFNDILLLLLEIYLKNREFSSLQQIERIIKDEIPGDLVVKKLKEEGTIKNRDANRESKRYFICIPLVCSRAEVESVSSELSLIFIHQTVHLALKLYVADFVITKMILEPSKKFIFFLLRYLEGGNFSSSIVKLIEIYLKPHTINNNPAASEWFTKHFEEISQKLLELLFSKLTIPEIDEVPKLLFLLEKFNLYGQNWINSYRWVLNSLEDINQIYSDHTIDCLEIFQMVLEKITVGNIPESVVQRFQKSVLKNWGRYTQEHLYAIERIVAILNEHSYIGFKQVALPPLETITQNLQISDPKGDFLATYISNITFNLFFGHIDSHHAFQSLLKVCDKMRGEKEQFITQNAVISVLNLLLFMFEGSEEAVDGKADDLVIFFLMKQWKNSPKVQGKCLEYLSRIPHSINILKLPLNMLTAHGFYNTVWLGDLTELLNIVSQSKPKAIGSYKLQEILKSMLVYLIASENHLLIDSLMDYLEATCFIEGDYQDTFAQCLQALENALKAERCGVDYRKALVEFALGALIDYQYKLNQETLWFLLSKYASETQIVGLILEYFEKFPIENSVLHEKLLMRVVLIHTEDEKIQEKCRALFKLHAPKSSKEQQLIENFGNSNFIRCEELIGEISNPYALTFSISEVRSLLEWKNTAQSCKKLLRFLHNHPENQNKFYQCEAFILNSEYNSYLAEVIEKVEGQIVIEKFQNTQKKVFLLMKRNQSLEILEKTLLSIMKNKQAVLKLKGLYAESFKNKDDDFAVLLRLAILIFSKQKKQSRSNDELKQYAKFWNELNGELQLKNKDKATRFVTKNLIYIFPLFLSNAQIMSPSIHYSSLLCHYRSVLISFSAIQKEIGSNRYFLLLARTLLQCSKNTQNKGSFVEEYLKIHLFLEGNEELILKEDDKQKYHDVLRELLALVNKITQSRTRENSTKLDHLFVNGYIAHLLFLINERLALDVATFEIVKAINGNIDSLSYPQNQKETIKQAVQWILKHIEKQLPIKVESKPVVKPAEPVENTSPKVSPTKRPILTHSFEQQTLSPELKKPQEHKTQTYQSIKGQIFPKSQLKPFEQEQPYLSIKIKEREEHITITETITTHKTTIVVLNSPSNATELFNEVVDKPREETFNEEKFYKSQTPQPVESGPSKEQRQNNLEKVQKLAPGQNSIQSLKDHCKFISTLALLPSINSSEFTQLLISIESITETVSSHSFYVRKVSDFEIAIKLVRIYKTMWRSGEKKTSQNLVIETLKLFVAMSKMKQRKLVIFSEQETVQFFKMVVKRRLNSQCQEKEIEYIMQILYNCRNNNEINFSLGLISMLIEIINRDKEADVALILEYFIKIDLTPQIINEIYQRGSFNKLVLTFSAPMESQNAKKTLALWIRLAGKVCINQSIQEKFRSKELNLLVWNKIPVLTKVSQRKDISYFLAYLCLKNEAITEWMIQAKAPEEILASIGEIPDNEELYLLFYHFCFGSVINRDYCFRIKYHMHLLGRLNLKWTEIQQNLENVHLSKYFYKSLGQLMTSRLFVSTFFKEEVVKKLMDIYNVKCEPSIFECLLDFISALQTEAEFDELRRQNFWDALKIFEFKISSEATYSYILQIFLVMIKKGRSKEFSQPELRNKVCLKAEFSINMEGKELALRFILALSIKDKQNYLTERSVGLLASVLGVKVTKNELQLANDMLKVEGSSRNEQFLRFFFNNSIPGLISQNLEKLTQEELKLAFNILQVLSLHASFKKQVASVCMPVLKKLLEKESGEAFNAIIQLINTLSDSSENKELFEFLEMDRLVKTENISARCKQRGCTQDFAQLSKNIDKMRGVSVQQSTNHEILKKAVISLRQGKRVKMYKTDGSISELLIFISSDCLELNCAIALSQVVKQKWRLPMNEILKVIDYPSQDSSLFQSSYFEKNSGFFNKAPNNEVCLSLIGKNVEFHICFTPGEKQAWKSNLQLAREYARNLLSKFGEK